MEKILTRERASSAPTGNDATLPPRRTDRMIVPREDARRQASILVVDDSPESIFSINTVLKDFYKVRVANSGEKALRIAGCDPAPDLILLDVMMPGMDGYEVCRRLKSDAATRAIPVIFLTARSEGVDETRGLGLGAADYVTKPIRPAIVLARIANHLELKAARDLLEGRNVQLEEEVRKRTCEVAAIQDVTIQAMASLAEARDTETGKHIRRTQLYVRVLAEGLRQHPRFTEALGDKTVELLCKSAPLHDIGKVGIPDRILLKPGRLDPEEFETMKRHAVLGRDAINAAERSLGVALPFLSYAKEIVYSHHEKWDGSGYPQGLSGNEIPVSARIMAIADVYDALTSRRIYKPPTTHEHAVAIIVAGKGSHHDPDMVDVFLEVAEDFRVIASTYRDSDTELEAAAFKMNSNMGAGKLWQAA